jgi:hypothetical protein
VEITTNMNTTMQIPFEEGKTLAVGDQIMVHMEVLD